MNNKLLITLLGVLLATTVLAVIYRLNPSNRSLRLTAKTELTNEGFFQDGFVVFGSSDCNIIEFGFPKIDSGKKLMLALNEREVESRFYRTMTDYYSSEVSPDSTLVRIDGELEFRRYMIDSVVYYMPYKWKQEVFSRDSGWNIEDGIIGSMFTFLGSDSLEIELDVISIFSNDEKETNISLGSIRCLSAKNDVQVYVDKESRATEEKHPNLIFLQDYFSLEKDIRSRLIVSLDAKK